MPASYDDEDDIDNTTTTTTTTTTTMNSTVAVLEQNKQISIDSKLVIVDTREFRFFNFDKI